MFETADGFELKSGPDLADSVVEFASKCLTAVSTEMKPVLKAIREGKARARATKNSDQHAALRSVAEIGGAATILAALESLTFTAGSIVFRRELLNEMKRALKEKIAHSDVTFRDAAWKVRERTRHMGRFLPRFAMGRTHLVKGLEFDHAIILDADSLSRKNLYVAITRGVKSLTILSSKPTLTPKPE
jgi:DNA helicase-2/ATP-dependent DNA helicase PcrA